MGKVTSYCKKCGKRLKGTERFCTQCGYSIGGLSHKKKMRRRISKNKWGKMTLCVGVIFFCVCLGFLMRKDIIFLNTIMKVEKELNKGNIDILKETEIDSDKNSLLRVDKESLSDILYQNVKVNTKINWREHKVTYAFLMPDMKKYLENIIYSDVPPMSEDEFMKDIEQYIKNSEKKWFTGKVSYQWIDNRWVGDYQNGNFLNSLSGGMAEGYQILYQKILEEFLQDTD